MKDFEKIFSLTEGENLYIYGITSNFKCLIGIGGFKTALKIIKKLKRYTKELKRKYKDTDMIRGE